MPRFMQTSAFFGSSRAAMSKSGRDSLTLPALKRQPARRWYASAHSGFSLMASVNAASASSHSFLLACSLPSARAASSVPGAGCSPSSFFVTIPGCPARSVAGLDSL